MELGSRAAAQLATGRTVVRLGCYCAEIIARGGGWRISLVVQVTGHDPLQYTVYNLPGASTCMQFTDEAGNEHAIAAEVVASRTTTMDQLTWQLSMSHSTKETVSENDVTCGVAAHVQTSEFLYVLSMINDLLQTPDSYKTIYIENQSEHTTTPLSLLTVWACDQSGCNRTFVARLPIIGSMRIGNSKRVPTMQPLTFSVSTETSFWIDLVRVVSMCTVGQATPVGPTTITLSKAQTMWVKMGTRAAIDAVTVCDSECTRS